MCKKKEWTLSDFFFIICAISISIWFGLLSGQGVQASQEDDIVAKWADTFGQELWELGQKMTKSPEIKKKYKNLNARVEKKNGETLINSIVENVGRMFQRKINAVNCIQNMAEVLSEEFVFNRSASKDYQYYNSKYSLINLEENINMPVSDDEEDELNITALWYKNMSTEYDTHFYNIAINTEYSSVHVPSNVYDKDPRVLEAIQYSEGLDEVFYENYNSDPALSWQYFGSDTGILRHYPAMEWRQDKDIEVDVYDCRRRSWYIETATCSKDVVILLDNTGSMTGYRNYIAKLTVKSILDTFSNNDFVNIYIYSTATKELIPCFKDMLVQATPENIKVFNEAVSKLSPAGYADVVNVTKALQKTFKLLENYRELRNCNESISGCNQAIMLITDGIPGNLTDVFEKYNRVNYKNTNTTIPVRLFIYALGNEVPKIGEFKKLACDNRGYFSHIKKIDDVREEVLKYVDVIATPLVLQEDERPPTWTHAFSDTTYLQEDDDSEPRLMIAVGVPAFDWKALKNKTAKIARLLGVAGTDVPVEDINKLTLPYKLGVNGYSFIVSNNGYVLLHPDLRPIYEKILKDNYNSIDLTEVEQFDDGSVGRNPGPDLLWLRKQLVNSETGKKLKVPVRFHYDNMRRASQEYQDYYFKPLANTPFSLGLVLPNKYGNTWIKVGDEVKRNQFKGVNISNFFLGENWKVHPEWVYCKYHYLKGHVYTSPEHELRHFLIHLYNSTWIWSEQYEPHEFTDGDCGGKNFGEDAYYCNKELMQLLVFDAKVTNSSYNNWIFENEKVQELIERYNATLRFVATTSGLTRWQFIFGEVEVDTDREFGDYHTTAIDETWYKSAVLQYRIDPDSFVFSVPHEEEEPEEGELKVTASHAIFITDGKEKAPAAVVGYQFSHALMYKRFLEITTQINCNNNCTTSCESDEYDCYVIDNNGYVILSETQNDTGRFFGEIEGAVMKSMIASKFFVNITIYDWQATCIKTNVVSNEGSILMTPIKLIVMGFNWLFMQLLVALSRLNFYTVAVPFDLFDDDNEYEFPQKPRTPPQRKLRKGQTQEEEDWFNRVIELKYEDISYACDNETTLYILQQKIFIKGIDQKPEPIPNCDTNYFIKRIPHSNLVLVVVNAAERCNDVLSTKPKIIQYTEDFPCHKLAMNYLPRRRLEECFTDHVKEPEYHYCGSSASKLILKLSTKFMFIFIVFIFQFILPNLNG